MEKVVSRESDIRRKKKIIQRKSSRLIDKSFHKIGRILIRSCTKNSKRKTLKFVSF